ncbi:hypothetical protein [Falsiruegeria mediterranea]|uniref:hypothetical protein n=1 Tax=Falsiruegeria mediterranea TaxID=1280832 RepID=UPI0015F26DBB|nr:hypothetical protein [Falsiruegeria mediterranea]
MTETSGGILASAAQRITGNFDLIPPGKGWRHSTAFPTLPSRARNTGLLAKLVYRNVSGPQITFNAFDFLRQIHVNELPYLPSLSQNAKHASSFFAQCAFSLKMAEYLHDTLDT